MKVTFEEVQGKVNRLKGKTARIDNLISDTVILRMAYTISRIPMAEHPDALLVDVGGSVLWLPLYMELLGYKKVIILCRPSAGFTHVFKKDEVGIETGFDVEILNCDAELSKYPINDGQASCVVSFETLEHFAGDPMNLIAESNRILRQNGHFYLTTPNVISAANLVRFAFGGHPFGWSIFTDGYADRHNREYAPFEVKRMLEGGGFNVSLLETFSLNKQKMLSRILGTAFSLPAVLMRRVSPRMRNALIFVSAIKSGQVTDRYPTFLYDLFGEDKVKFKVPLEYITSDG